jgi:AI-2 transport protein TqsA
MVNRQVGMSEKIVINFSMSGATRVGLNLLVLLGVVIALYLGREIFIPLVIAALLAGMVYPTVNWLNRRLHIPWGLSCMVIVAGLVLINLGITFGFALAVPKMLHDLPDLRTENGQEEMYRVIQRRVEKLWPLDAYFPDNAEDSHVFRYIQQALANGTYITNVLWNVGYYGNNWLWQWVLVMFLLLFMLAEGRMLSRRIVEIFGPSREAQAKAVATLAEMARAVRTFLVWRTLVNFALGIIVGAVYHWVFGLSQSWTWALLTAVACYVPYLGPIFAGIPPVLDAFVASPSPWYALAVIVFYTMILTLEGYVLVPVIMGRSMELNATTVMLACLFWQLVWGLPGLFLAMPLMAAIKAICAHVPGWRPWANLMSSSEAEIALEKSKSEITLPDLEATQLLSPSEAEILLTEKRPLAEQK